MSHNGDFVTIDCPVCHAKGGLSGTLTIDPGVRTFSNGDPGYPPSEELVLDECTLCGYDPSDADDEQWEKFSEQAHADAEARSGPDEPDMEW